jgi:hypothetical protein
LLAKGKVLTSTSTQAGDRLVRFGRLRAGLLLPSRWTTPPRRLLGPKTLVGAIELRLNAEQRSVRRPLRARSPTAGKRPGYPEFATSM